MIPYFVARTRPQAPRTRDRSPTAHAATARGAGGALPPCQRHVARDIAFDAISGRVIRELGADAELR